MWSACSFSSYLLNFMNKYLEGDIFTNNYVEGIAGVMACLFGVHIFNMLGLRMTFVTSFGMMLIGGLAVLVLEAKILLIPDSILTIFGDTSSSLIMHKIAYTRALNFLVPKFTFISKFGVNLAFVSTYSASFVRDDIFQPGVRATAVGQC